MADALYQLVHTLFQSTGNTLGVIPTLFNWITSNSVLPYFAIAIGCSLALFGVKVIRSVVWGS